jgi:hypothetical protein
VGSGCAVCVAGGVGSGCAVCVAGGVGSGCAVCRLQGLGVRERSGRTQADFGLRNRTNRGDAYVSLALRVFGTKKGEPSLTAWFPLWCYLDSLYSLMNRATHIPQVTKCRRRSMLLHSLFVGLFSADDS